SGRSITRPPCPRSRPSYARTGTEAGSTASARSHAPKADSATRSAPFGGGNATPTVAASITGAGSATATIAGSPAHAVHNHSQLRPATPPDPRFRFRLQADRRPQVGGHERALPPGDGDGEAELEPELLPVGEPEAGGQGDHVEHVGVAEHRLGIEHQPERAA